MLLLLHAILAQAGALTRPSVYHLQSPHNMSVAAQRKDNAEQQLEKLVSSKLHGIKAPQELQGRHTRDEVIAAMFSVFGLDGTV